MSSNTFPPVIFAASLAELMGVHIAELLLGTRCYVLSEDDNFYLVENASLVPNGTTVIQSVPGAIVGKPGALWATLAAGGGGGGGITPPSKAAVIQPVWYIDALTGNDANDGKTPATALATLTEWSYRIGLQTIEIQMTVNILTDLFSDDTPMGPINVIGGASLTIQGTTTTIQAAAFSAVTAAVPATNTPWQATAPGVAWGPVIAAGYRVRMTAGAGAGDIAWPAKDLGANAARFSFPATADPLLGAFGQSEGVLTTNAFVIEDMTSLGTFGLDVRVQSGGTFNIVDCRLTGGTFNASAEAAQSVAYGCQLGGATGAFGLVYANCGSSAFLFHAVGAVLYLFAGLVMGGQSFEGGSAILDLDTMVQDGDFQFFGTGQNIIASAQAWDWPTNSGVQVWQGATIEIFSFLLVNKQVWGSSVLSGAGFRVETGGYALYDTDTTGLTITGLVNQVLIGENAGNPGYPTTYAELPYIQGLSLSTTATKTAVAALTAAAPAAQAFVLANLRQASSQIWATPKANLGANVGWNVWVSSDGHYEIRLFTTTAGPIAVPQTDFLVTYLLAPTADLSGMFLL